MMNPIGFQSLLVAIDFSPYSEAALKQAVWLARQSAARLSLLHILPDIHTALMSASEAGKFDAFVGDVEQFQSNTRNDSNLRMRQLVQRFNATDMVDQCETQVGDPLISIINAAEQAKHDLVMIGSKGQSNWEKYLIGGTAKRLIRKCPSPVWAVAPEHCLAPKVVLVAIDFSEVSQKIAILAGKIARLGSADVHILHVIDANDIPEGVIERLNPGGALRGAIHQRASDHLDDFVKSLNGQCGHVTSHLSWGIPSVEITRFAGELKSDLLVAGTVGRTGLMGALLGNTAEKTLDACHCSVLAVKPDTFATTD